MKKHFLLLLGIILLALILRFYRLGNVPISLEWDEVALGYDAYSILKTGRDQFGEFLPISFRSLDDWKPPLYVYMSLLPVAFFGLNEFATRSPSAVFGVAAVILTYFFVLELFSPKDRKARVLALLSSFFLAFSPWHLQFSRAAFETNLSVTVTLAAVLAFLVGIRKKNYLFILSAVFFGIALFSYHSTRVVTPILLSGLFLLNYRRLPSRKFVILFLAVYGLFVYFFIPIAGNPWAQIRFRVTNDLEIDKYTQQSAEKILQESSWGKDYGTAAKIFHNRRLELINYDNLKKISANYFSHFSPSFLFVYGDAPLHHAPGYGMIHPLEAPFIYGGILFFIFKIITRKNAILFLWLLAGPIPASVTWQAPHGVRAEIIMPTVHIFGALGLILALKFIIREAKIIRLAAILFICLIFILNSGYYLHQYYVHTNFDRSKEWMFGRKEAVKFTEENKDRYDKVYISLNVDMPYIFWLFYTQYPPEKYLREGGTVSGGFADERNIFDKYHFKNFNVRNLKTSEKIMLVGTPKDFPKGYRKIWEINYHNGEKALIIGDNLQYK